MPSIIPRFHAVSGCKAAHRNPTSSRATATVTTGLGLCAASRRKRRHNRCYALPASAITRGGCPLRRWGDVFGDRVIASAILDRILRHATTISIRGDSYWLKYKLKSGLVKPTTAAT